VLCCKPTLGYQHLLDIAETIRIHLVLFGMQNRTLGPYLAAMHRILISAHTGRRTCKLAVCSRGSCTT
jgi:hypothetical protein